MDVILQHDLLRGMVEADRGQPAPISFGPTTGTTVDPTMAQQETLEMLASLAENPPCRGASPDQVTHRLMRVVRHPHRRQLASPMQFRECRSIATVGLYAVARSAWDQRRCNHDTVLIKTAQQPMDPVAARAGFIAEVKPAIRPPEFFDEASQCLGCTRNLAMKTHLATATSFRDRYRGASLMDVQSHECGKLHLARLLYA